MGAPQQVDDKVAGASGGVDDGDALIAELLAKFSFQHFLDGGAHEVDNFLRGIDDAVGICDVDAVTLEEALVDGVDEGLLVAEIEVFGGFFDGFVELVECAIEVAEIEIVAGEGANHFIDFSGDYIGLGEVIDIKNAADDALRHQVLDEHFVDGLNADVGVEGCAAEFHEFVESVLEFRVVGMGGFNLVFELGGDGADLIAVGLDSFAEVIKGALFVIEVLAEQLGEVLALINFGATGFFSVLKEHGGAGVFKDDVIEGITGRFLVFDFGEEIVGVVFSFPECVGAFPIVAKGAVDTNVPLGNGRYSGEFFDENQVAPLTQTAQQRAECTASCAFVQICIVIAQFLEGLVVLLEQAVFGMNSERRHQFGFRWVNAVTVF